MLNTVWLPDGSVTVVHQLDPELHPDSLCAYTHAAALSGVVRCRVAVVPSAQVVPFEPPV